jgi:phospholipid-binding lipoprotein MlaA
MYVPLLGPGPPRNMLGLIVDTGFNPITYMGDNELEGAVVSFSVGGVDARANNLGVIDEIERSSVDFYASVRSLYRQNRESEINNGETNLDELPDLDELDNY